MYLAKSLLAAAFIGGGIVAAMAQATPVTPAQKSGTTMQQSGSAASSVSAQTHCMDVNGQVKLKTAAGGAVGSATTGASTTQGSGPRPTGTPTSPQGTSAANLPKC